MMENKPNELLISHLFNAPSELVFAAWTNAEQLVQWYAPDGCTIEFKSIDVSVGGEFHFCINDPVHGKCWIKGRYEEIVFPEKLVFLMLLSNEKGEQVTANDAGKSAEWPEAIRTTVTFRSLDQQTSISLHQTVDENEAKKTGAYQSWFSMFDRLSQLVAQ